MENTSKKLCISYNSPHHETLYVFGDTIDELIDGLLKVSNTWFTFKFYQDFKHELSEEQLKRLDHFFTKTKNYYAILDYAKQRNKVTNPDEITQVILDLCDESTNPHLLLVFTDALSNVNREIIEEHLLKKNNSEAISTYCKNEELLNPEKFKNFMINSKSFDTAIHFFSCYPQLLVGKDTDFLTNRILKKGSPRDLIQLAIKFPNINIEEIEKKLIYIAASPYDLITFQKNIKNCNTKRLKHWILFMKIEKIFKFLKHVRRWLISKNT